MKEKRIVNRKKIMAGHKNIKERIDKLLVSKNLAESLNIARALIMEGLVYANGVKLVKSGTNVNINSEVIIKKKLCMRAGEDIN